MFTIEPTNHLQKKIFDHDQLLFLYIMVCCKVPVEMSFEYHFNVEFSHLEVDILPDVYRNKFTAEA